MGDKGTVLISGVNGFVAAQVGVSLVTAPYLVSRTVALTQHFRQPWLS